MHGVLPIEWRARSVPLAPRCVVGMGPAARELARRLLAQDDLDQLSGVSGADLLCVLGEPEQLPWVDGVTYLGADTRAPGLLHPCPFEPTVSPDLVLRAVSPDGGRTALLLDPRRVFSLAGARPIDRERLSAWLEGAG